MFVLVSSAPEIMSFINNIMAPNISPLNLWPQRYLCVIEPVIRTHCWLRDERATPLSIQMLGSYCNFDSYLALYRDDRVPPEYKELLGNHLNSYPGYDTNKRHCQESYGMIMLQHRSVISEINKIKVLHYERKNLSEYLPWCTPNNQEKPGKEQQRNKI